MLRLHALLIGRLMLYLHAAIKNTDMLQLLAGLRDRLHDAGLHAAIKNTDMLRLLAAPRSVAVQLVVACIELVTLHSCTQCLHLLTLQLTQPRGAVPRVKDLQLVTLSALLFKLLHIWSHFYTSLHTSKHLVTVIHIWSHFCTSDQTATNMITLLRI